MIINNIIMIINNYYYPKAFVGYFTNYVGVSMLFYPIDWKGIPLKRWEGQPLGFIGTIILVYFYSDLYYIYYYYYY